MTEISINHVQADNVVRKNKKVGVGGKLQIDEERLEFVPTNWDEKTGGDRVSINMEDVDAVGQKTKYTDDMLSDRCR